MTKSISVLSIALSMACIACSGNKSETNSERTQMVSSQVPSLQEKQAKAIFITETTEDSMGIPRTTVSVDYNDSRTVLDPMICSPTVYGKQEMKEMECPENTISAIGGWFAGGGDYYYIVPTATGIAVYKGYLDEGDDTPGYHWEKVKDIN